MLTNSTYQHRLLSHDGENACGLDGLERGDRKGNHVQELTELHCQKKHNESVEGPLLPSVHFEDGVLADPPSYQVDSSRSNQPFATSPAVPFKRENWTNQLDFLLSIIGFAVDLANVWRFPYLCYKNGGGAFLIPYFISLLVCAAPLFLMELLLGQYYRQGAITVWNIAPMFKGIGWCVIAVSYFVSFYYNVIIAWAIFYLIQSFTFGSLPWVSCDNAWNTKKCASWVEPNATAFNETWNTTMLTNFYINETASEFSPISAAQEYFENKVLDLINSKGIENIGYPRWQMTLCTLAVFTLHFLALCKGIKISGKVIWITALAPYVILSILLVRGLFLPGASEGIMYYITPKIEKLADPVVWRDAAYQIFFSVGAGFGVHLALASYNDFHHNCHRDFLITAAANSATSIFSGFVVFSYLGYMAKKQSVPLEKVATDGPGLVFIVYPEAISTLEVAPAWSIIFFIMLLTLGIDSAMGGFESIVTALMDLFHDKFANIRYAREKLVFVVVYSSFFVSLLCTTSGGAYVLTLMDHFAAGFSLLFVVLMEVLVVAWVYGLNNFNENAAQMLGYRPHIYWRICWKFIAPAYLLGILISSAVTYEPIKYESSMWGTYHYPLWANIVGWIFALSSVSLVPIYLIYCLFFKYRKANFSKLALGITPENQHDQLCSGELANKRFTVRHWISI